MQESRSSANERDRTQVRFRSFIIGSILIPVNLYWLMKAEVVWVSVYSTVLSLFFNVVFCLFVLVMLNSLSKRYFPGLSMNQGELLTIYVMLSIATGIFGHDFIRILIHTMGASRWFASPENEWADLFFRYLPKWLVVDEKSVLQAYYEGDSTLYTAEHLREWLVPVLAWSSLIFVVVFVMVCINVIIRKQWTENEKLTYPIIQLPLEMTGSWFFRNRLQHIEGLVEAEVGALGDARTSAFGLAGRTFHYDSDVEHKVQSFYEKVRDAHLAIAKRKGLKPVERVSGQMRV